MRIKKESQSVIVTEIEQEQVIQEAKLLMSLTKKNGWHISKRRKGAN